jgi:hypothetical protein
LDLNAEVKMNSAWEMIRENINISANERLGYFELKKHKPWSNKGCSKLLDQRKQVKLHLLQDPSEINGDNLINVKHEASRYFRHKKDKMNELAIKRGYQPTNNLVKDEIGNLMQIPTIF